MANPYVYPKVQLSKWLLTVTLFFSLLSYTGGYANDVLSQQNKTVQTEWVSTYQHKSNKLFSKYQKSFVSTYKDTPQYKTRQKDKNQVYNRLKKAQFDEIQRQFCAIKPYLIFPFHTILLSSKEDISTALVG